MFTKATSMARVTARRRATEAYKPGQMPKGVAARMTKARVPEGLISLGQERLRR